MNNKAVRDFTAKAVNDPDPIGTAMKTLSKEHPEFLELQKEIETIEGRQFSHEEGNCSLVITGNGIIQSFKIDLSQIQFPVKFDRPEELHQWINRIITLVNIGTKKAAQERVRLRKRHEDLMSSIVEKSI